MDSPDQPTGLPPGVKLLRSLEGHRDVVTSVTFDPTGATFASGSEDHSVKLWDAKTGQFLRSFKGHTVAVLCVAFDPAGAILASGSEDHTVRLSRVEGGRRGRSLEGHRDVVTSVTFDPTGATLASGSWDRTVKLWKAESGQLLRSIEAHRQGVTSVAFDPAGEIFASGDDGGTVKLWEAKSGKLVRSIERQGRIRWMAFDPAGTTLASGDDGGTVKLWEAKSGEFLRSLEGHTDAIDAVAWSRDGTLLASQSEDGSVRLWQSDSWEPVAVIQMVADFDLSYSALAFHPTEPLLATGGSLPGTPEDEQGKSIHWWQLDLARLLRQPLSSAASGRNRMEIEVEATGSIDAPGERSKAVIAPCEDATAVIRRKLSKNHFDVFLSYRSSERETVTKIGQALKSRGVLPWLDVWEIRPGEIWQEALEKQIENIKSVAVFLGNEPLARWQKHEVQAFVSQFVDRECPVIPVILPDAQSDPQIPIFLRAFHTVDFRKAEPDPLEQLIWGITGEHPG